MGFFDYAAELPMRLTSIIAACGIDQLVSVMVHFAAAFGADYFAVCHC
jgi:hypothetical protein